MAEIDEVGGVARYEGDHYHRRDINMPGNPWIITTLWMCQYIISSANTTKELSNAKKYLKWVSKRAQPSGILSEQIDPKTGEQVSVSPLIWSHAEFVITIFDYLKKAKELQQKKK